MVKQKNEEIEFIISRIIRLKLENAHDLFCSWFKKKKKKKVRSKHDRALSFTKKRKWLFRLFLLSFAY